MTIGEKIRVSRGAIDMTQQELADAIGVSRRAVVAYETAGAVPRMGCKQRLAKVLNVALEYLNHDEITDPQYGCAKEEYVEPVAPAFGADVTAEVDAILERSAALFAGGELSEEAKESFYIAITKAYLQCREDALKRARESREV